MKPRLSKTAAALSLAIATGNAHAVLTSSNTLSIQNDAVTSYQPTGTSGYWYVSSNGPLADSYFTMGGSATKQAIDVQFAYLYNGAALTLTGATQTSIATYTWYGKPGSYETVDQGITLLAASGDTATVNMSGFVTDWNGIQDIPVGAYGLGVGYVSCEPGSGCAVGSAYTLTFQASLPPGDTFGPPIPYYLELHGTVGAVPEAATYGMMLAGLGLVGIAARRRKQIRL